MNTVRQESHLTWYEVWSPITLLYFRSRLMVEYVLDVEGLTYAEFSNDRVREADVYERTISWYKTGAEQNASSNASKSQGQVG